MNNDLREATETTPLDQRPRDLTNKPVLQAGDWGYWPVLCAVPHDIEIGDRVSFGDDTEGDIVATAQLVMSGLRIKVTTPTGNTFTVGVMAGRIAGDPTFHLDRWTTHAVLSERGTR